MTSKRNHRAGDQARAHATGAGLAALRGRLDAQPQRPQRWNRPWPFRRSASPRSSPAPTSRSVATSCGQDPDTTISPSAARAEKSSSAPRARPTYASRSINAPADIARLDPSRVQDDRAFASSSKPPSPCPHHRRPHRRRHQPSGPRSPSVDSPMASNDSCGVFYKDKPAVHAVLEYAAELCFDYLEPFIDAGVSMISLADPTASGDLDFPRTVSTSLPFLSQTRRR